MLMICRDVQRLMTPFLRGELQGEERFGVHRHLATCAVCAAAVERARDAYEMTRDACAKECDPVPDEVPEPLIRAIWVTSHSLR
ncbi:MAG TPA: zf-HC2 domain-containing protein [Tepidisphaeraceae bacterium]|nr:zf-HC2 domain-containing protein [Tepidisphaeraceae bacterium]